MSTFFKPRARSFRMNQKSGMDRPLVACRLSRSRQVCSRPRSLGRAMGYLLGRKNGTNPEA